MIPNTRLPAANGRAGVDPSPNHLVRATEERRRNGETERLGGPEVDYQLELGRLLHRKICGLGAFQDLVNEDGRAPVQVSAARPVGDEAAIVHVVSLSVDGWEP